jgi:acyl-CoA reductase-like NAD-dependent aldehyde dehydrogenase
MSSFDLRQFLAELDGGETFVLAPESTDALRSSWSDAARAAREAYRNWRQLRSQEAYALYRACADRADAAQDALAARARPAG